MVGPPLPTKPLLLVTWKDHAATGSWANVEEFHKAAICFQVGWLWKEDREGITLVGGYSPPGWGSDQTGSLQYILKSCIVKRQVIKVK